MTQELFRENSYLRECHATVEVVDGNSIVLDKTVFYPQGGGQPGDRGTMRLANGHEMNITDTQKTSQGITHLAAEGSELPAVGEQVHLSIDWDRRHRFMRMHSCMHVLCSIIPFAVTGGSIREDSARLDFDAEQPLDKKVINNELNRIIGEDHNMSMRWISTEELDAQPELVRTMSVQPPRDGDTIRLVEFEGVDLQPCGGTHVKSTAEIGAVRVSNIEKKGKHNRRINIVFDE